MKKIIRRMKLEELPVEVYSDEEARAWWAARARTEELLKLSIAMDQYFNGKSVQGAQVIYKLERVVGDIADLVSTALAYRKLGIRLYRELQESKKPKTSKTQSRSAKRSYKS